MRSLVSAKFKCRTSKSYYKKLELCMRGVKISLTASSQNGWMRTAQSTTAGLRTANNPVFSMICDEQGAFHQNQAASISFSYSNNLTANKSDFFQRHRDWASNQDGGKTSFLAGPSETPSTSSPTRRLIRRGFTTSMLINWKKETSKSREQQSGSRYPLGPRQPKLAGDLPPDQ